MQKITPCLWFDDKAEEAANFYVSIFKNSRLETLLIMEKKDMRFTEGKKDQF